MAMKMNATEKQNDNIIRAYNSQIEKSVKQLGYYHTVTQNLINNAKLIFGENNIKQMAKKSRIDSITGNQVHIPQISRNKKTVSSDMAKKLQTETKTKSGTYKNMYDVSKHYQKAIDNAIAQRRANIPDSLMQIKDINKRTKAIKNYVNNVTKQEIRNQINIKDLISETFEQYKIAKERGDDVTDYIEFANDYHSGNEINHETLLNLKKKQYGKQLELETTQYASYNYDVGNLADFIDILT